MNADHQESAMNMPPVFEQIIREKMREGWSPDEIKAEVDAVFAKMTAETAARIWGS